MFFGKRSKQAFIENKPKTGWVKKGDIVMKMTHEDGSVETRTMHNVIVDDASLLMAELFKNSTLAVGVPGLVSLAVGTGSPGWDLQNPPIATASQTQLVNELTRKVFASTTYLDPITFLPTPTRTNVVNFETEFLATEAVGAIVEMGLFGGTGAELSNSGTMVNYHTLPVWNKNATSTLTIGWQLTF
jgi:hypothetical protein